MGACTSLPLSQQQLSVEPATNIGNDYELVVRCCKELDTALLALQHHPPSSTHPGLHELISGAALPPPLEKRLRFLATVRNRLIHEPDCERLDAREAFAKAFVLARGELAALKAEHARGRGGEQSAGMSRAAAVAAGGSCVVQ